MYMECIKIGRMGHKIEKVLSPTSAITHFHTSSTKDQCQIAVSLYLNKLGRAGTLSISFKQSHKTLANQTIMKQTIPERMSFVKPTYPPFDFPLPLKFRDKWRSQMSEFSNCLRSLKTRVVRNASATFHSSVSFHYTLYISVYCTPGGNLIEEVEGGKIERMYSITANIIQHLYIRRCCLEWY